MKRNIVLTGILKDNDLFFAVKRNENDILFPGAWEFPGGHLEDGETIKQSLARELKEEIGFNEDFNPIITHYTDEIKQKDGKMVHNIEIDFMLDALRDASYTFTLEGKNLTLIGGEGTTGGEYRLQKETK